MEAIREHAQQHLIDAATNPATSLTTMLAGYLVFIWDNAPKVVAILTACLLICQLIAWFYKFYLWLRS
jgi:hypothetical protein